MIASNPTDRQWYLNRILGESCIVSYFDQTSTPEFSESPKPFNPECYTSLEIIIVSIASIGRAPKNIPYDLSFENADSDVIDKLSPTISINL